jgi:transcriptional regulator with XRE-family HTH domain
MDAKQMQRSLGRIIQARRSKLGYSQESFADYIGVHRTYVGSVERGERNITLKNLLVIAKGLKMPLSTMIAVAEAELIDSNE